MLKVAYYVNTMLNALACPLCLKLYQHYRPRPNEKSLMFKYGRMQKEISSQLVCGSHGACLDYMLPRVQVIARRGFFSVFKSFM